MFHRTLFSIKNIINPSICRRKNSLKATAELPNKIFSGIQPTGIIHLGNYLGAITQWIKLQEEGNDMSLCIVDQHSMTLPHNPKLLPINILQMTATLLAVGLDPKKVTLFQQSTVPQHTELFWYFSCISTMARLNHLPQFKEKSEKLKDIPLGLYIYPVLQAADILAYRATHVPVGEDQLQHLQLAQDIARMFNNRFGNVFPIPKSIIAETSRIRSLRDPSKKMSKSDPDPKSCIFLTDSEDDLKKKFKKAVTDFTSAVTYDPKTRPGVSNLILIHSAVTGRPVEDIVKDSKNVTTGQYKFIVAEDVNKHIAPIREKYFGLIENPQYLQDILEEGRQKVTPIAEQTVQQVRENLGIRFNIQSKDDLKIFVEQ